MSDKSGTTGQAGYLERLDEIKYMSKYKIVIREPAGKKNIL
jgi:hypothetical protein